MHPFIPLLAAFSAVANALSVQSASTHGLTVQTTSGKVYGHVAPNVTNVTEYLGIPYALSPLGDLRFAPPEPRNDPHSIIHADHFGYDCLTQSLGLPTNYTGQYGRLLSEYSLSNDSTSEDCLFLNIWTPQSHHHPPTPKPVLIWFYGGGYTTGGTDTPLYTPSRLVSSEDVIVVTFNYRLNIFGFPGSSALPRQNLGFLDQRLAVEWVRDNIHAFGGDPTRITAFGQSAGAGSIDYYTGAYPEDPIIAAAIFQSGSTLTFGARLATSAQTNWDAAAHYVGCDSSARSPTEVVSCMRVANASALLAAANAVAAGSLTGTFNPTVDNQTVYANYSQRLVEGEFARIPLLVGNNNYEAGVFQLLGVPAASSDPEGFTRALFTCPSATIARSRVDVGVPVWRYYYSGMFPNLLLPTNNLSQAYHTAEVPIVFGVSETISGEPDTLEETELTRLVQGAWAAFARDPVDGLTGYGWTGYDYTDDSLVLLGGENTVRAGFESPSVVDADCGPYPWPGGANS